MSAYQFAVLIFDWPELEFGYSIKTMLQNDIYDRSIGNCQNPHVFKIFRNWIRRNSDARIIG